MYKNIKLTAFFLLLPSLIYSYDISLKKGWNLMGFNEEIDATKLLSSNAKISSLWAYDTSTASWMYAKKSKSKNDRPLLKSSANAGMWITVDSDIIINMNNNFLKKTNSRNYVKSNMVTKNRSYSGTRGR